MDWFAIVKRHYDAGRFLSVDVAKFVLAAKISAEQYEQITGLVYDV